VLFLNRSTQRTTRTRPSPKEASDDVAGRKVPATRGFLLCVATLVMAIAASVGVASPADSATARMAVGSCDPKYPGHAVSSHLGYGYGWAIQRVREHPRGTLGKRHHGAGLLHHPHGGMRRRLCARVHL
jgi:hypothetical protein